MSFALLSFAPLKRFARWTAPLALLFSLAQTADAAQIDLISAGEGTRTALRMTPRAGTTERFEIVLDMDMKMDMGEMGQMPTDLPPLAMVLEANIDKVDPNGDIHYRYELVDIAVRGENVDAMMRAALEKELPKMKGAKGTHVVSNTGVVKSSTFEPPAGAPAQQVTNVRKGMNHASASFPEEPVGIGAKWRVTQGVSDNGLELDQTVVYTLKEHSGNKVVLVTEMIQKPGDKTNLSSIQGATAELMKFQSMGDGESVLDLTHLFPTSGTLKHYLNSVMAITQPAGVMNVGLEMDMNMTMERK